MGPSRAPRGQGRRVGWKPTPSAPSRALAPAACHGDLQIIGMVAFAQGMVYWGQGEKSLDGGWSFPLRAGVCQPGPGDGAFPKCAARCLPQASVLFAPHSKLACPRRLSGATGCTGPPAGLAAENPLPAALAHGPAPRGGWRREKLQHSRGSHDPRLGVSRLYAKASMSTKANSLIVQCTHPVGRGAKRHASRSSPSEGGACGWASGLPSPPTCTAPLGEEREGEPP